MPTRMGRTLVFENARVLPVPEKPGDKVGKVGVGIYKQDRETLTYLPGAVYELYTVDDIYSADGTKLLDAGAKMGTSSATNESGFTWFDVDVPIRGEYYIDPAGPRSTSHENSGRYRIVEITAPAGYLLDSTPVDVEFTYEGQQIAWQIVDGTNTNLRTGVDISKQDISGRQRQSRIPAGSARTYNILDKAGNPMMQTAIWWRAGLPQKRLLHRARSGTGKARTP